MVRNRKAQRDLEKKGVRKEKRIKLRNLCGIKDPTPYEAVKNIVRQQQMMEEMLSWE